MVRLHDVVYLVEILYAIITSAEEGGYVFGSVCLSVCLFVCLLDYSQTCEQILTKFFGGVGHGSRTKWYNFGGDPDHALDPGVQSPKFGSSGLAEVCALWVLLVAQCYWCNAGERQWCTARSDASQSVFTGWVIARLRSWSRLIWCTWPHTGRHCQVLSILLCVCFVDIILLDSSINVIQISNFCDRL